jgi:hypothetical protein
MVDHSVYANAIGVQANSRDLPGSLVDRHGHTVHDNLVNDSIGVDGKFDIMHLSILLQAAGIQSLDQPSKLKLNNCQNCMTSPIYIYFFFLFYLLNFPLNSKFLLVIVKSILLTHT